MVFRENHFISGDYMWMCVDLEATGSHSVWIFSLSMNQIEEREKLNTLQSEDIQT